MNWTQPAQMQAAAIDRFGGPETVRLHTVPLPALGPTEVLIRVAWAGVGEWDPFEREGGYAQMLDVTPAFPYILGSEGAGTVAAIGAEVERFTPGDHVFAVGFLNPSGGFYAEYAAVSAELVAPVPDQLTMEQAAVLGGVGITALRGLDDTLKVRPGETVLIFGASGGIGHVAVQFARRLGARVLAVASGDDGVALARQLGADAVVNGRDGDVLAAARTFAPDGLDTALLTAGGEVGERALTAIRAGGRVAYPNGVQPEPAARPELRVSGYNGEPDGEVLGRLTRLIGAEPFALHIARTFPLAEAATAHRALAQHYLGKLVLRVA